MPFRININNNKYIAPILLYIHGTKCECRLVKLLFLLTFTKIFRQTLTQRLTSLCLHSYKCLERFVSTKLHCSNVWFDLFQVIFFKAYLNHLCTHRCCYNKHFSRSFLSFEATSKTCGLGINFRCKSQNNFQ